VVLQVGTGVTCGAYGVATGAATIAATGGRETTHMVKDALA